MSDALMDSLRIAIEKVKLKNARLNTNEYTPIRQPLKKYKGSLVVFNEETQEFNYY